MRRSGLLLIVLLAVGCGGSGGAPWLTYSGPDGHAKWFPLVGTPHDVTAAGATVTCEGCHTDPKTFANPQCATACHSAAAMNPIHTIVATYNYATADCMRCHPDGSTAPPPDHDTKAFPRGTGTKHAGIFCSSCHTDFVATTDPASFACASCHATRPGFSTAHANVTGVDGTTQSPDCLKCHGDGQVNTVAAHQAPFPIQKGSQTHDTVCLQCHTSMRTDKTFAADFSTFACTGCHAKTPTDTAHAAVTGYVYASPSCYSCHPAGVSAPLNHDTAFFPGAFAGNTHHDAGVTCTQCHTDLLHPSDPTKFACGTCHLQRDASLVTKHTSPSSAALTVTTGEISTSNSATCLACHADSQVTTSHPSGGRGSPPHQGARCTECHDVYRTDKPFGIDFASDPALASKLTPRQGCYHCHDTAPPQGN
jgi:hypothetical protein